MASNRREFLRGSVAAAAMGGLGTIADHAGMGTVCGGQRTNGTYGTYVWGRRESRRSVCQLRK